MKFLKGKMAFIVPAIFTVVALAVIILIYNRGGAAEEPLELTEVAEPLKPVEDLVNNDETQNSQEEVTTSDGIDPKNFKYDPFAEDSGWGNESIFGNKIIIAGTGKADTSGLKVDESGEADTIAKKNTRKLSAAESQAALMEEVKSKDYNYRINEKDFSEGFGIYMNPKYELTVGRIMGDTGYIKAPNNTEVGITELDPKVSLMDHRKNLLTTVGYNSLALWTDEPSVPRDTPIAVGSGIDNFKNTKFYNMWVGHDLTVNDYGGQLWCDTKMESKFGSGCYIEVYSAGSESYYGYYLVEHNGRIFKATGMSTYRDTLLDIVLATIDTCVYPY